MDRSTPAVAALALVLGIAASPASLAATSTRNHFQNAAGMCQAALPVFEGNIRKRPTAVANEGTAPAFVSCSMETAAESSTGVSELILVLYNRNASAVSVTCSLVHSFQSGGTVVPKTLSLPGNGERTFFIWTPADVGNPTSLRFANYSCGLPVGVEVGYGLYVSTYEIGT